MARPFDIPERIELAEQEGVTYPRLIELMRRLLAPDGCPWDREQSIETLRPYVLEEACEVMDAIDSGDRQHLKEELGDLAFQVVYLSELAQREGAFGPDDVIRGIIEKLVRRHPHVFERSDLETPAEVERQWDAIKALEKHNRPLLDNIPRSLPALEGARRMSERVASVGFDWTDHHGSRDKVVEELRELDEAVSAEDMDEVEHELGDTLFALVNYARHLGVDPERALAKTTERVRLRFNHVELRVKEKHGDWPRRKTKATVGIPLDEMEDYWSEAKRLETKRLEVDEPS